MEFSREISEWTVAVVAGVGAAGIALRFVFKKVRAGIRDIQSVHELIRYQLSPNGGHSIVDRVKKIDVIETKVSKLEEGQKETLKRLEKVEHAVATPKDFP